MSKILVTGYKGYIGSHLNTLANNQSLIDCGWKPKVHFNEGLERCFAKALL